MAMAWWGPSGSRASSTCFAASSTALLKSRPLPTGLWQSTSPNHIPINQLSNGFEPKYFGPCNCTRSIMFGYYRRGKECHGDWDCFGLSLTGLLSSVADSHRL